MIDSTLRAKILAYDDSDSDPENAQSIVIEDSEANIKWVGYKIQLSEVQRAQNVAKRSAARGKIVTGEKETLEGKVVSLGKKMKTVEADYMFRRIDAGSFSLLFLRRSLTMKRVQRNCSRMNELGSTLLNFPLDFPPPKSSRHPPFPVPTPLLLAVNPQRLPVPHRRPTAPLPPPMERVPKIKPEKRMECLGAY